MRVAKKPTHRGLPSKQQIVDYLKSSDGLSARRDVARALGVKGEDRAELRRMLRELEAEGRIARAGRRVRQTETLPAVGPIDVMSIDDDGDLICLPSDWRGEARPPMIRIAARKAARMKPVPGVGDRLLARLRPAGDDGYEAEVIRALGKGAHRFLAMFRKVRGGAVGDPVERRTRHSFVIDPGDEGGAKEGDLVWLEARHERGYGPDKARVRAIAGHIDDRHAYSLIALASHGVPIEFPAAALKEAEAARRPPLGDRIDLRDVPLLTIDPEDAKDHDDAVFAAPDDDAGNEGGFKVTVAIADVSWFVPPDGALDREAQKRGNSVYLPDRVVPMLPERLSNDLCSLRVGEDRPCLAVEMILTKDGRKRRHRFMRAMMRSCAKLSYGDAQAIIEGAAAPEPIGRAVRDLADAFKARWTERQRRAPLDLDLPERKVVLDADGRVVRVEKRERLDAHRLIEEFMILANIAAAETLEEKHVPRIYRVHDAPDPEKLGALRDYLQSLDYQLAPSGAVRPGSFNQILKRAEARDEKEMISEVVLRTQKQAVYSPENLGHFGLNIPRYAHFTSPIRRYADLTVHRALVSACKLGPGGQTEREAAALGVIAEKITDSERRAMSVERESKERYLAEYLAGRLGAEFDGRIRGVTRFGLFVMLDETGADGFAPVQSLGDERFRFMEERHALVGERTGAVWRLGQPVRVRLLAAAPLTGGLRFEIVSDPLPDPLGLARSARAVRKGPSANRAQKRGGKGGKASGKARGRKSRG